MTLVHLHGHSTFSFLEAIGLSKDIIAKAAELHMPAIAITDYYGMYGAIREYNAAKETAVKPIIGVELGFVLDHTSEHKADKIGNITLLARGKVGYHNLLKLTSLANTVGLSGKPKIDIQQLKEHAEDLIVILGGGTSRLHMLHAQQEKQDKLDEIIRMIIDAIGLEHVLAEVTAQDYKKMPEYKKMNDYIIEIASKFGLQIIVANNYHYINQKDKVARETALAIKDAKKLYELDRRQPAGDFHIMTEEEIRDICVGNGFDDKQINEWIENTVKVADTIDTKIDLGHTLFPNYETPPDIQEIYDKYADALVEKSA